MNDTTTVEEQEPFTWALTPGEYAATVEKIAKINARAEKRGFTGRLEVIGTRREETVTNQFTGIQTTRVLVDTRIAGTAPQYNGWTFLARVDALQTETGTTFTLAVAPGVEHVDRSLVNAGHCDHCNTDRYRKNTYLVRNTETGETLNVGSSCIKDFLGWSATVVFFSEGDVAGDIDGLVGGGAYREDHYSVDTVLAYAYAAIKAFGWVPGSAYEGIPTKARVRFALTPPRVLRDQDREVLETLRAYAAEANEQAAVVRAWILSDEFNGTSTYVDNLKVAVSVDYVTDKQVGILASAPQAYIRHLETAVERAAREAQWAAEKAAKQVSDYIAPVGAKKVRVEGTISAIRYIPGDYGTTTLYTILTKDGNLVKWFSSSEALGDKEGVEVTIEGTVKAHDDYQGTKSTVLTRCKDVNAEAKRKALQEAVKAEIAANHQDHDVELGRGSYPTRCYTCNVIVQVA